MILNMELCSPNVQSVCSDSLNRITVTMTTYPASGRPHDRDFFAGCLLNIWRASSELQTLLKEGSRYKVYQLATSEGRKFSSSTNLQLTATKRTRFQHLQVSAKWHPCSFYYIKFLQPNGTEKK